MRDTFEQIFRREQVKALYIEGDAFHRYDRVAMRDAMRARAAEGNREFSHFGPEANLLDKLVEVFEGYGERGEMTTRHYVHDILEAEKYRVAPGTFTDWETTQEESDLLLYEGFFLDLVT